MYPKGAALIATGRKSILLLKQTLGGVAIGRSILVFFVLLSLCSLALGEDIPEMTGDKPASEPELIDGKEVTHWSGLPVWGAKEARELGYKLPLPLGVAGGFYAEKQSFDLPELKLGGHGLGLVDVGGLVRVSKVKTEQSAWEVNFDAWVLPFLKLYAIAGYVDGRADIEVRPAMFPLSLAPGPKLDIKLEYEGPTLGLGGTLATGFKPFKDRSTIVFGLMDLNLTTTILDFKQIVSSLDTVEVMMFSPRVGVRECIPRVPSLGDLHVSLWGGLMYQGVQQIMRGRLDILDMDFRAKVESVNPWSTIIGSRLEIGEHFDLMIEIGIGSRESILLALTYRF